MIIISNVRLRAPGTGCWRVPVGAVVSLLVGKLLLSLLSLLVPVTARGIAEAGSECGTTTGRCQWQAAEVHVWLAT